MWLDFVVCGGMPLVCGKMAMLSEACRNMFYKDDFFFFWLLVISIQIHVSLLNEILQVFYFLFLLFFIFFLCLDLLIICLIEVA